MYALRVISTGQLLGIAGLDANCNGEFCVNVSVFLDVNEDNIWVVKNRNEADNARQSTNWYNAGLSTPEHKFKPKELEVVELSLVGR